MKNYRNTRKAVEKAQEAERKAQMKAMRARAKEAAKGKGLAKKQVLLNAAILNNAQGNQGGGSA